MQSLASSGNSVSLPNRATPSGNSEFDAETSFSFYRARYYDQKVGRFLSEDRIRFSGGSVNFYAYVKGDPVSWNDPSGKTRIHGNWCGPNWTGGLKEQYNPAHDPIYKDPVDYVDEVCEWHDKCYYRCRKELPCDQNERRKCMRECDYRLSNELNFGERQGYISPFNFWSWVVHLGIMLGNFSPNPGPNGGPDEKTNCPTCKSGKAR
jgi:RHS repeat-associated protein